MRVSAVVLAAGRGVRMGADENKVYLPIAGRPLLQHTLSALSRCQRIHEIVLVVRVAEQDRARALLPTTSLPCHIVFGGTTRRDSARAGVDASTGDLILIHDGARPFPRPELIERVIDGAIQHRACVPVLPVVDTVRYTTDGAFTNDQTVAKTELVLVQTPQGFHASLIRRCLANCTSDVSDDAEAVLACGEPVWTVLGEPINVKITTPIDVELAEAIHGWMDRPERST
jgi:2-C-methyl-D-erythritol 4-phosphate cytidylyltransferase